MKIVKQKDDDDKLRMRRGDRRQGGGGAEEQRRRRRRRRRKRRRKRRKREDCVVRAGRIGDTVGAGLSPSKTNLLTTGTSRDVLWVVALGWNEKAAATACDQATGSHIDTTGPSTASGTKGCLAPSLQVNGLCLSHAIGLVSQCSRPNTGFSRIHNGSQSNKSVGCPSSNKLILWDPSIFKSRASARSLDEAETRLASTSTALRDKLQYWDMSQHASAQLSTS